MIKQLVVLILIYLSVTSCDQQKNNTMNIDDVKLFQEVIPYPYTASEKRRKVILNTMNALKKGMSKKQVIELLTAPDEANLRYKWIKTKSKDNVSGFSFVYILKRDKEKGSEIEKAEQLIRIHFDTLGKLIWAFGHNIENFKNVERE
ncbi:hypothetical protein [Aquimarina aquimarini]|uniref:hypothetical protein n=1 Tax=Aquimarina aquimarini TaxID=1191734 RepID=UPI001F1991F2|nr:hypothetical protein [Aquimarina aquimarini]